MTFINPLSPLLQWAVLLCLIVIINILVIKCNWSIFDKEGSGGFDPYHLEECDAFNPDLDLQMKKLKGKDADANGEEPIAV